MSNPPASYKLVTSALKRAEELESKSNREDRVVAYYCRLYAVHKAMKLAKPAPGSEEMTFVTEQMMLLEKLKPSLNLSADEGPRICREYADKVFTKADDVDRCGNADKGIAKLFYAAGTFYDILEQFGDLDQEVQERKKYAKWKATDILNSINNGLKPSPGGYGEQAVPAEPSSEGSNSPAGNSSSKGDNNPPQLSMVTPAAAPETISPSQAIYIPSPPVREPSVRSSAPLILPSASAVNPQPVSAPAQPFVPPSVAPVAPATNFQAPRGVPINNLDPRVQDAAEMINFALTALKHNELGLAKERLQKALAKLG
eukprot:gene4810-5274_t